MSNGIKGLIAGLILALVVCLVAVGFLLGRQGREVPGPQSAASPTPAAVAKAAPPTLDERIKALETRVESNQRKLGQPNASTPPSSPSTSLAASENVAARDATVAYFRQVDAIVGGRAAIADSRPFSTRLLEQAMGSDFDAVLTNVKSAKSQLAAVSPPAECKEHRELLLAQLSSSIDLLEKVRAARASGNTSELESLAARPEAAEAAVRLRELDKVLRPAEPAPAPHGGP